MSGEGIIFGPIHFQNTQKGLRYQPGFRPDLEARGPPADFVDLDQGHRETAILPACIRRQLPFVGNVWIFRDFITLNPVKFYSVLSYCSVWNWAAKFWLKKKISKFHMASRCSSTRSPVSSFSLTRKRKKGSGFIHRDTLHSATSLILLYPALQTKLGASCTVWAQVCFPTTQHLQMSSGNLLQAGEERSKLFGFLLY